MLTWSEVPPIDQNGVITHYEVEYNQTTFNSTSQTLIINASTVQDEYTTNTTMEFNQTASNATSQNVTVKIITRYNIVICIIYDDTGRIIYYWYKVLLIELHEYVEYFIRIRAHTDVGPGPYSDVVNVTTEQDGELEYDI